MNNFRINYRYLLPITIGNGQKVYIQGSVVRRTKMDLFSKFLLPCGQRVEVMQVIRTSAELTD